MSRQRLKQVAIATTLAGLVLASASTARAAPILRTTQRTMTLGGKFTFSVDHVDPESGGGATGVKMEFSPSFGIFIVRNLLLSTRLTIELGVGDLYDNEPKTIGFGIGLTYIFNFFTRVAPYVGFGIGPDFLIPDQGDTQTLLGISFPFGILIALNRHVAIDVGSSINLGLDVTDPKSTILEVPIGYLGVRAFF
jgi:hypothetical protein